MYVCAQCQNWPYLNVEHKLFCYTQVCPGKYDIEADVFSKNILFHLWLPMASLTAKLS